MAFLPVAPDSTPAPLKKIHNNTVLSLVTNKYVEFFMSISKPWNKISYIKLSNDVSENLVH